MSLRKFASQHLAETQECRIISTSRVREQDVHAVLLAWSSVGGRPFEVVHCGVTLTMRVANAVRSLVMIPSCLFSLLVPDRYTSGQFIMAYV